MMLHDYLRVFREQWLVVVVAVVFGLLGGAGVYLLKPAEFTAGLTMYVSSQGYDSTSTAFEGAQLSEQRVQSYVELVGSRRVSEDVVRRLGLTETPDDLSSRISATTALNSVLIDVSVYDRSPVRAAELANAVGAAMSDLVSEIERPLTAGGVPAVVARVVSPASVPSAPSSPGLAVSVVLGLLMGLAVGAAGALGRNALDTTVKSPETLRKTAGAPNLGSVAFDVKSTHRPLIVQDDLRSQRSEAFRRLRTNLDFVDVDNPHKVMMITSAVQSEGKTTTLANLAIAMGSARRRVLLIDADLRRPKLAELLGMEGTIGLTSVLTGKFSAEQVIQRWGAGQIDVLASGPLPPNPSELLASRQMRELARSMGEQYDLVLIDTPPLLPVTDAAALAPATDGVLLVCRFKSTSSAHVKAAVEALHSVSAVLLGTVFTMVPPSGPHAYSSYGMSYLSELPARPADVVPPDGLGAIPPRPTPADHVPSGSNGHATPVGATRDPESGGEPTVAMSAVPAPPPGVRRIPIPVKRGRG